MVVETDTLEVVVARLELEVDPDVPPSVPADFPHAIASGPRTATAVVPLPSSIRKRRRLRSSTGSAYAAFDLEPGPPALPWLKCPPRTRTTGTRSSDGRRPRSSTVRLEDMQEFDFDFHPGYRYLLLPWGVTPGNSLVAITDDDRFHAKFGRWEITTPMSNISGYQRSGDYKWYKAIGIRGSMVDHGLTFGSTTKQGVCVTFTEPIKAFLPGMPAHPGLTVTVSDADGLAAALQKAGVQPSSPA